MSDTPATGIVTPEAVLLELPAAGIATRLGAKVLDLFLLASIGGFVGSLLIGVTAAIDVRLGQILMVIWYVTLLLIAPMALEGLMNGRTPGKATFGLRVVTLDGGPIQWRHAFIRAIAQVPDVYLGLGILPALMTRRSQRFGDLMAGTFVLVERHGGHSANPIAFLPPPGWENYVYSLDVGRIRPEQYRLIRTFLLRVNELTPQARWTLGVQLAEAARRRVGPDPPTAVEPEKFLVCVASAYQHRNGGIPRPDQIVGGLAALPGR